MSLRKSSVDGGEEATVVKKRRHSPEGVFRVLVVRVPIDIGVVVVVVVVAFVGGDYLLHDCILLDGNVALSSWWRDLEAQQCSVASEILKTTT